MKRPALLLLSCVVSMLLFTSCNAKTPKQPLWAKFAQKPDSTCLSVQADSLLSIVANSTAITAEQLAHVDDSLQYVSKGQMEKPEAELLLYLLLDEEMKHPAPNNIFAMFCPMVRLTFDASNKKNGDLSAIVLLDVGLSQWRLCDADGNKVAAGVIPDRRFIRFFHFYFPDNEAFKALYTINL